MYPTNLTDSAWQVIQQIIADKRKRKYSLRSIFDAILYVTKTGCQWRQLPKDLPPWPLCYYYFWKWRNDGTWQALNKALVQYRRKKEKCNSSPSVGIIDSQSIKCSEWGVPCKGFDGHKKIKGRKRHIVVDRFGLVLGVVVHAANIHDSPSARLVVSRLAQQRYPRLTKLLADSAYGQKLAIWMKNSYGMELEVIRLTDLASFQVVPMRWKVERTFAWMNWDRRLSKDYECDCSSSEAFVYISNIHRILRHF